MQSHIKCVCPMKEIECDECKQSLLRKDMDKPLKEVCREGLSECPFAKYGCKELWKLKYLDIHLARNEVYHLKLQVKHQEMKINELKTGYKQHKLLFLLNSNNACIYDVQQQRND